MRIEVLHLEAGLGALLAVALGLTVLRFALQVASSYIPARVATDMQVQLRSELFASFTRSSWGVQSRDREGQLQEIATNQIGQATASLLQANQLVVSLLTFLVLVVSALALNMLAAGVVLVIATVLFVLLRPLSRLGSRYGRALSRAGVDYAGGVNESVRLAEEIQVFGVGAAQREQIDGADRRGMRSPSFTCSCSHASPRASTRASSICSSCSPSPASTHRAPGRWLRSAPSSCCSCEPAGTASRPRAPTSPCASRCRLSSVSRKLSDAMSENVPHTGTEPLEDGARRWPSRTSRSHTRSTGPSCSTSDFEVTAGEAIGIVGPTGAGKSTLVQILLGLRPPTSGRYLVNGVPAEEFSREDWHRAVAYLPQEPRLLHASVADNIRFFRPLDDQAVERAARLAGIHDDIMSWSAGYDTVVGPRADAVSGGQQQRICLARALAAHPEVLVLDEPTSALDPHTERLIQDSLNGAQARADHVHRRPPHVDARHLRPGDGDRRRPSARPSTRQARCTSTAATSAPPPDRRSR